MSFVIAIEGIIGAGKTTVATKLGEALNYRVLYEPVKENPYLKLFYDNPKRWAFPMQIELLHRRYAAQKLAAYESSYAGDYEGCILDRSILGDRVFRKLYADAGNMSQLEWRTYRRCVESMLNSLVPPTLLVYLEVCPEVALERVKDRAREEESTVSKDYLDKLYCEYSILIDSIKYNNNPWTRGVDLMVVDYNNGNIEDVVKRVSQKIKSRYTFHSW